MLHGARTGTSLTKSGARAYKSASDRPNRTVSRLIPQRQHQRDTTLVQETPLSSERHRSCSERHRSHRRKHRSRWRDTALIRETPFSLEKNTALVGEDTALIRDRPFSLEKTPLLLERHRSDMTYRTSI